MKTFQSALCCAWLPVCQGWAADMWFVLRRPRVSRMQVRLPFECQAWSWVASLAACLPGASVTN